MAGDMKLFPGTAVPRKLSVPVVVVYPRPAFAAHVARIIHPWADVVFSASARAGMDNAGKWSVVNKSKQFTSCINQTDEHSFSYLPQQG